ncbi:MAG: GNAT family N-acetyltransferase [Roseiflexaceae bacterium]
MHLPPLTTTRLHIRPFTLDDVAAVHTYTSNPHVMAYIDDGALTLDQTRNFVQQHLDDDAKAFAVTLNATNDLAGHIIAHPWFAHRTFEIGWVFHPTYHDHGYATEAARAVMDYCFETLDTHRVIATCQPENPASYRVMEKLGMRREAHFRQCIYRGNDIWWDEYFYAILDTEWRAQQ